MSKLPQNYLSLLNSPCAVICLKRNKARYFYTKALLENAGFQRPFPFEAIDGILAKESEDEWDQRIRPFGDFLGMPFRKKADGTWLKGCGGQLGMTMSLLTLWGWVALSNKPGLLVLEDDALPRPDLKNILPDYWNSIKNLDVDMVYIGGQIHPNNYKQKLSSCGYYVNSGAQCLHAHYITKKGAQKVLDFMPFFSELRSRRFSKIKENDDSYTPIDTALLQIQNKVGLGRLMEENGLDPSVIPEFKAVSFVGSKVPVDGEYEGIPWEGRSCGIIHQNADLASNIHGLIPAAMRKTKESEESGTGVYHEGIFKVNKETGEGYITKKP